MMSEQNNNNNNNITTSGSENPTLIDSAKQVVGQVVDTTKQVVQEAYKGVASAVSEPKTDQQAAKKVVEAAKAEELNIKKEGEDAKVDTEKG